MDPTIQRLLAEKLYDKRKVGALELEDVVRTCVMNDEFDRIDAILTQLCDEYAYSVHHPNARNGGLIGLAAVAVGLGRQLPIFLARIVPPALSCFTDQDPRVRYYACEAMYNIAKIAKGEILVFFNEIFDVLCRLGADPELSVKNGADLLDRLIRDIVAESASSYVSVLDLHDNIEVDMLDPPPIAFSIEKFIPLLKERIWVINPFTRQFLVGWITLLDSIPDLEMVTYLPEFLAGLLKFLNDQHSDVHVSTQNLLNRFLREIRHIVFVNRSLAERRARDGRKDDLEATTPSAGKRKREESLESRLSHPENASPDDHDRQSDDYHDYSSDDESWVPGQDVVVDFPAILEILTSSLDSPLEDTLVESLRWIEEFLEIGPDEVLPFTPKILEHMLPATASSVDTIQQAAARVNTKLMNYIVSLPDIGDPKPAKTGTGGGDTVAPLPPSHAANATATAAAHQRSVSAQSNPSAASTPASTLPSHHSAVNLFTVTSAPATPPPVPTSTTHDTEVDPMEAQANLDYDAAVHTLTLLFHNDHEATRSAALTWLTMLHRKARKILTFDDSTFPTLLATLQDPSETVVSRDLQLLTQIARYSDQEHFTRFMINLLELFQSNRKFLETRGNMIIRQLCAVLPSDRIYRTLADCIAREAKKDEKNVEFASYMVLVLNNNLITAPQLGEIRRRLRSLDGTGPPLYPQGPGGGTHPSGNASTATVGSGTSIHTNTGGGSAYLVQNQLLFSTLFRTWCYNAVATFSLCLLSQAYEQAYHLLQIIAELEMTVEMLVQIDKLAQLIESPVFTHLRLQLLEPDKYPFLYKCLYGLLMLLPQSSTFGALRNRLNSVSAIGYLHMPIRPTPTVGSNAPSASSSNTSSFERSNRLKGREDPGNSNNPAHGIRWTELFDKFREIQFLSQRILQSRNHAGNTSSWTGYTGAWGGGSGNAGGFSFDDDPMPMELGDMRLSDGNRSGPGSSKNAGNADGLVSESGPNLGPSSSGRETPTGSSASGPGTAVANVLTKRGPTTKETKPKSSLGRQLGRFGGAMAGRSKK